VDRLLLARLAVLACGLVALRFTLWRALLFLWPESLRVEADEPPREWDGRDWGLLPLELRGAAAEMFALGFVPLGTHVEKPLLGPTRTCFDLVNTGARAHATLFQGTDHRARVYLLTTLEDGGYVVSAGYRRPAREVPGRYLSGYLENATPERVVRAHLRRVEGHAATLDATLEGRVAAQRAWYRGPGRPEVRQRNARGLLWSVGTLGMVAWVTFGIL
jgi:hypothetical protein